MPDTLHILDDLQLDENLRYVEIGDILSPIELSKTDVRLGGDLDLAGTLYLGSGGIIGSFGDIAVNSITLEDHIYHGGGMAFKETEGNSDYLGIYTSSTGLSHIVTVDTGGMDAHLRINPDGDLVFTSATNDIFITDTSYNTTGESVKISFDGNNASIGNSTLTFDTTGINGYGSYIFKPDPAGYFLLDFNNTNTGGNAEFSNTEWLGLRVDYDKTGSSTSDNIIKAIEVDVDYTSATDGTNTMYGIYCTPTLTHASDAGTTSVVGGYFKAVGGTNGTSTSTGIVIDQDLTADTTQGLVIQNSSTDYFRLNVAAQGATTLQTLDDTGAGAGGSSAHLTLDADGDVYIKAHQGQVYMQDTSANDIFEFDVAEPKLTIADDADTGDYFRISVGANGESAIETKDDNAAVAHLNIEVDGHVEFDNCAVGFDKLAGTFSTSGVIGDGNDSTDIDFRLSNKYELELTDNISGSSEFINMIFPNTSGNFLLVISQDGTGSRTVHADGWVVYQSDGSTKATNAAFSDGTDGAVRWSGGSAPTLTTTANKADIISIYWDADNQTAFAVASLNF